MQETSQLETMWQSLLQSTGHCPAQIASAQLTMQSLNGVFSTLAAAILLSILALIGEYVYVAWGDINATEKVLLI